MNIENVDGVDTEILQAAFKLVFQVARCHAVAARGNVARVDDSGSNECVLNVMTGIRRHAPVKGQISGLGCDDEFVARGRTRRCEVAKRLADGALAALESIVDCRIDYIDAEFDRPDNGFPVGFVRCLVGLAQVCADSDRGRYQALCFGKVLFGNAAFQPLRVATGSFRCCHHEYVFPTIVNELDDRTALHNGKCVKINKPSPNGRGGPKGR